MLYTKKGDDGTTKSFHCDQRMSKSSAIAEALGALDETNSFLGLCKIKSKKYEFKSGEGTSFEKIINDVQKDLFIIGAEVAGSKIFITEDKVKEMEIIIDYIERELPPIKSFFVPGGSKLAVYFDIVRTVARRAERRVVEVSEEKKVEVGQYTLAYLNRLSSLLYAAARLANHRAGISEESPDYK